MNKELKKQKKKYLKEEIRKFKNYFNRREGREKYKPTYLIIQAVLNTVYFY